VIGGAIRRGANVRRAGEDLRAGQVAVRAGTRLRPQEVAAIASTGAGQVRCHRRLRVGVLSTGDELVEPGEPLALGQVYDSNRHLLAGLLAAQGAEMAALGRVCDTVETLEARLRQAAIDCDVILTTGGVSRGETDFVVETIRRLGSLHAWQIAVKPGRPLAMGQIGDAVVFGLPGNPVAVFVTFARVVRPLLLRLAGAAPEPLTPLPVRFAFSYKKKKGRREYVRVALRPGADGAIEAFKHPQEGAGVITSLTETDGLAELPEDATTVEPGSTVGFLSYATLMG
jgi:molybdopterin molybdotransferase